MNIPTQMPSEDPVDVTRPNPADADPQKNNSKSKEHGKFKRPANSKDKVTEADALTKAKSVGTGRGDSNPKILRTQEMSYKEALQVGSEPLSLQQGDPLVDQPVWVVEMEGSFKVKSRKKAKNDKADSSDTTDPLEFTKAVVILNAADGDVIGYRLFRN